MGKLKNESGCVYSDGKNAYVELTRYRYEKPVQTLYGINFKQTEETPMLTPTGKQMYRIDAGTAAYLTGKSAVCPAAAAPVPVSESRESIAARCTHAPIARALTSARHEYPYTSPAAWWLYPAAGLDWLCVDLTNTSGSTAAMMPSAAA